MWTGSSGNEPIHHIVVVTPHDYGKPSAVASRHIALARGLAAAGFHTRFMVIGSADVADLNAAVPEFGWCVRGGPDGSLTGRLSRLRHLPLSEPEGLVAVLCIGRDPFLLRRGRQAANHAGVPALVELTEFPDVVVPRRLGRRAYLRALEYEIGKMDGAFVISSALHAWVLSKAPRLPVFELPMIVDLGRFPTARQGRPERRGPTEPFVVGYAGSLKPTKDGLDIMLEAMTLLPTNSQRPPVHLRVWGDGIDRAALEDLVRLWGLADRVSFNGLIPASEIPAALMSVDCLVLPRPTSRQAAGGFPTKLGEYLATGSPVVATVTGDIAAKIGPTEAFLVQPDDARLLADAVTWVVDHPTEAAEVGRAGRLAAEREFSTDLAARLFREALIQLGHPIRPLDDPARESTRR